MAGGVLKPGSQYGESEFIIRAFGEMRSGMLVDVGAADGYHHSNAYQLVTEYGWRGLLIEPHPEYVIQCRERYKGLPVKVVKSAIKCTADDTCVLHLYEPTYYGQVSTTDEDFKRSVIEHHGNQYTRDVVVRAADLGVLMQEQSVANVDFVNIDCEGCEVDALKSFPWDTERPRLFCVEMASRIPEIEAAFDTASYRRLRVSREIHNALYAPEERADELQALLDI
jgi:FkbM family methyltransferase